jgi:hypothetical protein
MTEIAEYIKRAAHKAGFKREFFLEKNMPTQPSNIIAIPFWGDLRSTFILSSMLLKSYKDTFIDKYIVLCSWPGFQGLFSYVHEYWTIEDESVIKTLATGANNLYNETSLATELTRNLVEVLNVVTSKDLREYYNNGFTQKYWQTFGGVKRYLPEVASVTKITQDFKAQMERRTGTKIVVYPSVRVKSFQMGKTINVTIPKEFWIVLIERLIEEGYSPVVYQNSFTYDVSVDLVDKCLYLVPKNVLDVLAAFRHIGCVLDVHSGISRLAIAARTPFLSVTERRIFVDDRDYEIDDLCCDGLPRQYIFSFSTMLLTGGPAEWKVSIIDNIVARLKEFMPTLKGIDLPSTNESYESIPYERVRQRKAKRIGCAFIKLSKNK